MPLRNKKIVKIKFQNNTNWFDFVAEESNIERILSKFAKKKHKTISIVDDNIKFKSSISSN